MQNISDGIKIEDFPDEILKRLRIPNVIELGILTDKHALDIVRGTCVIDLPKEKVLRIRGASWAGTVLNISPDSEIGEKARLIIEGGGFSEYIYESNLAWCYGLSENWDWEKYEPMKLDILNWCVADGNHRLLVSAVEILKGNKEFESVKFDVSFEGLKIQVMTEEMLFSRFVYLQDSILSALGVTFHHRFRYVTLGECADKYIKLESDELPRELLVVSQKIDYVSKMGVSFAYDQLLFDRGIRNAGSRISELYETSLSCLAFAILLKTGRVENKPVLSYTFNFN